MTRLTLATWSGFWCSTPPWRRKPHGAPPDNVIITSSATIVLLCLSFWTFLLFLGYFPLFFNISSGGPSVHWPHGQQSGPPQRALTRSLPATLSGRWLLSESSSEADAHTWTHTHAHTHFCAPTHAQSGLTIIAKGKREGERNMMGGGVCVCLHWGMPASNERGEGPTQHLSCHSDLCHWVADSPSKNRTTPPILLCLLLCRPGER